MLPPSVLNLESGFFMIEAGEESNIDWGEGNWIFIDLGFAQKSNRSCGLLVGDAVPICVSFGQAREIISQHIKRSTSLVNLVIEAPLSVCFDSSGNPKGRKIENSANYWYQRAGCVVMVAAMYLIRDLAGAAGTVRVFEGFVSNHEKRYGHKEVVSLLKDVVRNPHEFPNSIYDRDELSDKTDVLCSAFCVASLNCGVPAVIKPNSSGSGR
jgi:hypothetical protein